MLQTRQRVTEACEHEFPVKEAGRRRCDAGADPAAKVLFDAPSDRFGAPVGLEALEGEAERSGALP